MQCQSNEYENEVNDSSSDLIFLLSQAIDFNQDEFATCFYRSDFYCNAPLGLQEYINNNIPRLYRIIRNMKLANRTFQGPTLDVASGYGILYPVFKKYFTDMMPYSIAEMFSNNEITIDNEKIECIKFECDKTELPLDDSTFGTIVFLDTIEHLIIDPVWTILEFNRVLRKGGHLIISTPNVAGACRISRALAGLSPNTENEYKPQAVYQRHNREWTVGELDKLMKNCGFGDCIYSTNDDLLTDNEIQLINLANNFGISRKSRQFFGPEIFCIAQKKDTKTLKMNLTPDERWPKFLYTSLDCYRKRPRTYPINVDIDYYG
ncbi:MAG: class I SAM-dependent methyltransferase [Syntrophales bacterium]